MSQSRKGECMDFFTEAVRVLRTLTKAIYGKNYFHQTEDWSKTAILPENQVERSGYMAGRKYIRPPIRAEPVQTEESANRTDKIYKKSERRKTTYRNGGPSEHIRRLFLFVRQRDFLLFSAMGFNI